MDINLIPASKEIIQSASPISDIERITAYQ